jgi:homeodomain-containing protein
MDKYRVTLTAEERVGLEKLVSTGTAAARKLTHANILLLTDTHGENLSDEEVVAVLNTSLRTVARVRELFVTHSLLGAIDRKSQPPRPDKIKIKGDLEQKLVKLACSDPPQGSCYWTLQMLADELVVLGLLKSVSVETVRQALKKTTLSLGSPRLGVSRPKRMRSTSGGWKT